MDEDDNGKFRLEKVKNKLGVEKCNSVVSLFPCVWGTASMAHSVRMHSFEMKWNEWCFRQSLCTWRLRWARRTYLGWWDKWDDTALQTQDSKFEHWRSEVEHATSRSRRLPTILNIYESVGKNNFVSLKLEGKSGIRSRDLRHSKQVALTTSPRTPQSVRILAGRMFVTEVVHYMMLQTIQIHVVYIYVYGT